MGRIKEHRGASRRRDAGGQGWRLGVWCLELPSNKAQPITGTGVRTRKKLASVAAQLRDKHLPTDPYMYM